jgi:hypothetical protein
MQVDNKEPHPAVAQGQKESGIAREAIQLSDDQHRAREPSQLDIGRQFWPVGVLAALDLTEPRQHLGTPRSRNAVDRLALRLEPESAGALPSGDTRS